MRHFEALHRATYTVETNIRGVMLAAAIETAADFNVQISNGLIQLYALGNQPVAKFPGETARGRNP
jgi:hypothetical protein